MNKWFFRWHSRLALFAFLPLLLISVTGSLLVFKHEIDSWLMQDKVRVVATEQGRLSLDQLAGRIHESLPNHEITGWLLFRDQERADQVYVIPHGTDDWHYLFLDQYNGQLLTGPVSLTAHLTDWLLSLHFTFLLDDAGLVITAVYAVLLCFLGISGIYLHRRFWKNFFTLRWRARRVVFYSDLHKMVGIIASPVLLVLGFTGGYWNIQELWHEAEEHADGQEHHIMTGRLYNDQLSLQGMLERTTDHIQPFQTTYISFPYEPGLDFRFFGEVQDSNPLISQYASTVHYDVQSGEFVSAYDIREAGVGMRILDTFRRLHFGDFGGMTSRVIWTMIGLLPLVLAFTGVSLWLIRRRKKLNKKQRLQRLGQRGPEQELAADSGSLDENAGRSPSV